MAAIRDDARRSKPLGPLASLAGTLALLAWIGLGGRTARERAPAAPPPSPVVIAMPAPAEKASTPAPAPIRPPVPKAAPAAVVLEPDRKAVARAEADLDAATRARAVAEARLADAEIALRKATLASASAAAEGRTLAYRVRDPSAQIERASNRVARTKWETKTIEAEIAALENAPRPKAQALQDKGAVARPIDGKEYHFEIHGDRVAFVDIDKLTEMVKNEVRLHLRISLRGQPFEGEVGPIGGFTMKYEMGMVMPEALAEALDMREISYQLRGWEIVPERPDRGETYDRAWQPMASFARTVGRLNPEKATITFWIYPDGFAMYRRLRDDLHARGFLVAARPLPKGMTIRGSPAGSRSAGQ